MINVKFDGNGQVGIVRGNASMCLCDPHVFIWRTDVTTSRSAAFFQDLLHALKMELPVTMRLSVETAVAGVRLVTGRSELCYAHVCGHMLCCCG